MVFSAVAVGSEDPVTRITGAVALALSLSIGACEPSPPGTASPECSSLAREMEEASIELGEAIRGTPGGRRDEKEVTRARARLGEARAAFEEAGCG